MSKKILSKEQEIQRSIITTFRSRIWSKFTKAIAEYHLIDENDHIAVCISGGKDSMLLAKCMQILQMYGEVKFKCSFIVMNPGYNQKNLDKIIENAKTMDLPIEIFNSDIFEIVANQTGGSPCYLCARMRRGALYQKAQDIGCNKIALGHHFDDVIETTLLSMLYGGKIQSMMPKLKADHFKGLELIRPFYYVREKDIITWCNKNQLEFIRCACHFTENVENGEIDSKRKEIKNLLIELRKINKNIDMNIFKSMYNVNIDTAIAYQKDTITYHFLDTYGSKIKYNSKEQFSRLIMQIGEEKFSKLANSKIAIFGIGGVGGYVAETLARSGISTFYLYDPDIVTISNINRQIMANFKTLGMDKVSAMKEKILAINPEAKVYTYKMFVDENALSTIDFSLFDYCIDALDTIKTKILLIKYCQEKSISLICAMGAGNHDDPSSFKVMDLAKTYNDPIAKVLRRELKKYNIIHQKVVCSLQESMNIVVEDAHKRTPSSNAFSPASCGIIMANEVVKDLTK